MKKSRSHTSRATQNAGRRAPQDGHFPVMLGEVLQVCGPLFLEGDTPRIIDGTFGGGGYTKALLRAGAQILAIDQDPDAIARGADLMAEFGPSLRLVRGRFAEMERIAQSQNWQSVDAIVLDIGMSSFQLGDAARGFSFQHDGPLDMRMGNEGPTAADWINELSAAGLERLFRLYGEEPRARRAAQFIVENRPFTHTLALADTIARAIPDHGRTHPATRIFQALRIAVNDELGQLETGLLAAERLLAPKGRLIIVSFHSLEDRIVKRFLVERSRERQSVSRFQPEAPKGAAPSFDLKRGGVGELKWDLAPRIEEINANPRARSARLRWASRTEAPAQESREFVDLPDAGSLAESLGLASFSERILAPLIRVVGRSMAGAMSYARPPGGIGVPYPARHEQER